MEGGIAYGRNLSVIHRRNEALLTWTGLCKERRSRNGNLVNFGNADEDGANLNDWNPQNTNDNVGFFLSRSDSAGRES